MKRCSSVESSASSSAGFAEDQTVMEAAEALTDLAHLAMRENAVDSPAKWGSKGKRVMKRVKSESPPPIDSVDLDLPEDRAEMDQQQGQMMRNDVITKPVKAEQDAESLKPSSMSATTHMTMGGGRSRQNLTEAEKEARRIRRILANRESARQTIRRRQALCEELTRKAADLAWENEDLKKKREVALNEYQSLEARNKQLKAQMAKAIKAKAMKAEVEETPGELKSAHVETSASPSMNHPLLLYNQHPFLPYCWPSIIQSSNPGQSQYGPQNAIVIPPNIPLQTTGDLDCPKEQNNGVSNSGPRTPLYIVPCPWFYPVPEHGNGLHPQSSFGLRHVQDETSLNNRSIASSSLQTVARAEHHHFSLPIKVKAEARPTNDLNETLFDFPPDGGSQRVGTHFNEMILTPAPQKSVAPTFTVKHNNGHQSDYAPNIESTSIKASHNLSSIPEKDLELANYPSKKITDAITAAEARKRRKELTKLKNLHGRQCRMHC